MSTLLNHQLFEFAVRAFQDTVSRFMRESNPRPPGPEPGAPQLELMDLEGLLSVSFNSNLTKAQLQSHRDSNPARLHLLVGVALSGELLAGAMRQSTSSLHK